MAWMEMVRLRAAQGQMESATGLLFTLADDAAAEQGVVHVSVYQSADPCTDLVISLVWDTDTPRQGSRMGLSISELLRPFGLVEHSMWVERQM
jgi:hypothetical protein